MPNNSEERKEEEFYIFSPEELIEDKEPKEVISEEKKEFVPEKVVVMESKDEKGSQEFAPKTSNEKLKKELSLTEHPVPEAILEEKIAKEVTEEKPQTTSPTPEETKAGQYIPPETPPEIEFTPKETLAEPISIKEQKIPKVEKIAPELKEKIVSQTVPKVEEISFVSEQRKKIDLSSILHNIPWKLVGLSFSLVVVVFAGYYGYSYFKSKIAEKEEKAAKESVKLELPVEIEKSTATQETAVSNVLTSSITSSQETNIPVLGSIEVPTTSEATQTETYSQAPTEIQPKATQTPILEEKISTGTAKEEQPKTKEEEQTLEEKPREISYATGQVLSFEGLTEYPVSVKDFSLASLEEAVKKSILHQGMRGKLEWIRFIYQNRDLTGNLIQEYFLQPSFADQAQKSKFFQNLSLEYAILFYYTYTKKYPILVFRIKDPVFIKTFLSLWSKESLIEDSKPFYFTLNRGRQISSFQEFVYRDVPYSMVKFSQNQFKFIWSIYQDFLIFSTAQAGFEELIDYLQSD